MSIIRYSDALPVPIKGRSPENRVELEKPAQQTGRELLNSKF